MMNPLRVHQVGVDEADDLAEEAYGSFGAGTDFKEGGINAGRIGARRCVCHGPGGSIGERLS